MIGVDEHTAAIIDFGKGEMSVMGAGGVTLRGADDRFLGEGETITLETIRRLLGEQPSRTSR